MKDKIKKYSCLGKNDTNHRYKSWEHCFNFFLQSVDEIDFDKASLHLAFYLASWGMYRGSSYLLNKDYLIHKGLVESIVGNANYKNLQNWDFTSGDDNNNKNIKHLFNLNEEIKKYYKENIKYVNGTEKTVNVSDVLSTKIILGIFGCVPAFDRFFIDGFKKYLEKEEIPRNLKFNEKSFSKLIKFYSDNQDEIDPLSNDLDFYTHKYPPMKIVDMYFWQIGFDNASANKKLNA